MASDLDDSDSTDISLRRTKIIKSAFDSESFDSDGTFQVDGLVGSATISPSGRDIALVSPEGLAIIDLDSPYSVPRRVKSHGTPWLVVDVQWSPFAARDYWVASTANHCCLVWNLNRPDDSSAGAVEHSLRGHRRSITDINFSAHHPDILATCAVDGYVHCWDLRRPSTPALTFIDWVAGATQVKYNRQDDHVIASSHNSCVHIWDDRKPSLPLRTIEAHSSSIYGLDWNRTRSTSLVTCSLDKTIKFWDYTAHGGTSKSSGGGFGFNKLSVDDKIRASGAVNEYDVPERVIRTKFPVWRARHTPFGEGILAMPQTAPGHLYLYDALPKADIVAAGGSIAAANDPVAVFPGHGHHKVKEFLWRTRGGIENDVDDREFQLVSLGEDNKLRLRRLDGSDLAAVRYHRGQKPLKNLNITRRGAAYKTFRVLEDMGEYEKRSATMSSFRPHDYRSAAFLPPSQGQSRRASPTPEEGHHHSHHHHHSQHHQNERQVQTRHHSHQHHPQAFKTPLPSIPPPRSLSSSNIMRDATRSPALSQQRVKYDQRVSWRNPSMRAVHTGRRNADQTNEQLDWMKGVTMNKRRTSADPTLASSQELLSEPHHSDSHRRADSGLSSPMHTSAHDASISMNSDVNEPESIQEEIKRVTTKLPYVEWEVLDMDNLSLVASMEGPWGVNDQIVFFKVRVDIPSNYPALRSPRFYIESSSLVPKNKREWIAKDLATLTSEYQRRKRKCLLVAFRYLLGEIDLNRSLALLDRAISTYRLENADSTSSSSSDDEDIADSPITAFFPSTDGADAQKTVGPALPLPPPPPPRSCGAVFTRDGRLVMFFLTKTGKATAKVLSEPTPPLTLDELSALEKPVFIGFGKVLPSRIGSMRHGKVIADGVEGFQDSSSDESESSTVSSASGSSSSSSSSSSSDTHHYAADDLVDPWSTNMKFQRRVVKGSKSFRKRRVSDYDNDPSDFLLRSAHLDLDYSTEPQSKVIIEDMRPYLPSKRDLARDYAIFGDGAEVCEHNARVAEKFGEADLANIWRYASMLLKSDVPLRLTSTYDDFGRRQKSILVIAREAVANAGKENNGTFSGRVKWGLHPLAREFVNDLFDYFERLADVQMLAMLSCVFGESFEEDSVAYAESHLSMPDIPLPMKAPSFSLDYVPIVRGYQSNAPSLGMLSGASTSGLGSGSNNSSTPATPTAFSVDGPVDPEDEYDDEFDSDYDGASQNNFSSGGETPHKWLGDSSNGRGSGSGALSSSPSFGYAAAGRFFRRGNNAVISAIAAGIPQTLTSLLSSSPIDRPPSIIGPSPSSHHHPFSGSTPPSQKHSPPTRTTYLNEAQNSSQSHKKPLLLHSTSNYRDIPYPPLASQRLFGASASTSPRNTAFGKLSSSLSSSPQDHGSTRKRQGPAETIFSNLTAGNFTWAASALFGGGGSRGGSRGNASAGPSTEPGTAATSLSDDGRRGEPVVATAASKPVIKGTRIQAHVQTFNDHLFDDDGWMVASLLGGQRRRRLYAEYRYAYSELLQFWSESLARLEVLKFNILREDALKAASIHSNDDPSSTDSGPQGSFSSKTMDFNGRHDQLVAMRDSGRGLDAVGICQLCELQMKPLEYDAHSTTSVFSSVSGKASAAAICNRCRRVQSQLRCVYCSEPVDAIYVPCFGCGCASHPRCLKAWYDYGEKLCAAGDECPCPEEAMSGRVESWTALQARLMTGDAAGRQSFSGLSDPLSHDGSPEDPNQRDSVYLRNAKSRGLITQAQHSAHYSSSSSSATLVSPHGQSYHAEGGSKGGKSTTRGTTRTAWSKPKSPARQDNAPVRSKKGPDSATRGSTSSLASGTLPSGATLGSSSPNTSRRSKPAVSSLRQQLQQQQLGNKQQGQPWQDPQQAPAPQTQLQADDRQIRRLKSQEQPNASYETQGSSGSSENSGGGKYLSAARLSLSKRLLGGTKLRGQEANFNPSNDGGTGGEDTSSITTASTAIDVVNGASTVRNRAANDDHASGSPHSL